MQIDVTWGNMTGHFRHSLSICIMTHTLDANLRMAKAVLVLFVCQKLKERERERERERGRERERESRVDTSLFMFKK